MFQLDSIQHSTFKHLLSNTELITETYINEGTCCQDIFSITRDLRCCHIKQIRNNLRQIRSNIKVYTIDNKCGRFTERRKLVETTGFME